MKTKAFLLLGLFLLGCLPTSAQAGSGFDSTVMDARAMLYASESMLLEESLLDTAGTLSGLSAAVANQPTGYDRNALLGRMIHAKKMERNDLDAQCRLLEGNLRAEGKNCEADRIKAQCDEQRNKINITIGYLRGKRGDQRKLFTKMWHSIKRSSSNFWHRIGPLGRNILRNLGNDALATVVSGGSLNSGVLKALVKQQARALGQQKIKQIVYQGVERMMLGQLAIAQAAGVDLCQEAEAAEESQVDASPEEEDDCAGDPSWVADYWDWEVIPELVGDNRNCQTKAVAVYRACLQDQAIAGLCQEEAVEACNLEYRSIPQNISGVFSPNVIHGGAQSVSTSITIPQSSGGMSGEIFYILEDDTNKCTITITSTFTGNYDQESCTMQGTAQLSQLYEGLACPGICGPTTGECPTTHQGSVPWQADIEDEGFIGKIGNDNCEPGCVGFGFSK